jgi:hypothetical protein
LRSTSFSFNLRTAEFSALISDDVPPSERETRRVDHPGNE